MLRYGNSLWRIITNTRSRYLWIVCIFLVLALVGTTWGAEEITSRPETEERLPLWSVPTGCTEWCGEGAGKVSCSYRGERVAAGYGEGIIEIRNRQGEVTGRWQSSHGYYRVWSVGISRDGSRVIAVIYDPMQDHGAEVVYLNEHGRLIWQTTLKGPFGFAGISDNGSVVAVTDSDRISFYDRSGNRTGTKVLEGMIWSMQLAGDGSYAVARVTPRDYSGNLYLISNNGTIEWYSTTVRRMEAAAISGDGEYLAGSGDGQIRFFAQNGTRVWKFNSSIDARSLAISSRGEYVAAGSQYHLRYFNHAGKLLWQYDDPVIPTRPGSYFTNIAMTDKGEYVAATTRENSTLLFNNEGELQGKFESRSWVSDMCMTGCGNAIVIGTGQEIRYFETGIAPLPDPGPTQITAKQTPEPETFPITPQAPVSIIHILLSVVLVLLLSCKPRSGW